MTQWKPGAPNVAAPCQRWRVAVSGGGGRRRPGDARRSGCHRPASFAGRGYRRCFSLCDRGIDVDSEENVYVINFGICRGRAVTRNGTLLGIFAEGVPYPLTPALSAPMGRRGRISGLLLYLPAMSPPCCPESSQGSTETETPSAILAKSAMASRSPGASPERIVCPSALRAPRRTVRRSSLSARMR
jgi:hypothetical protein